MAFTHVQSVSNGDNGGSSTASSGTLSSAPSSGDLVVFYVNRNDSINISLPTGGSTWTELDQQTPPTGETASHAVFWKIAGASEPTSYSAALNATDTYHTILRVFSSSSDAAVDVWSHSVTTTSVSDIICDAIDGDVISDDAVSIVFGGKDRNASGGNFNSATPTDYIGELGSFEGRFTASAYKIYTTGTTFSGSVDISSAGSPTPDKTYSYHVAFVESASGAYTLTADSGSYTVSGTDASLLLSALLGANSGSYTYSGTDIGLNFGFVLAADAGAYAYSGTNAALNGGFRIAGDSGSYSYSGTAAALEFGASLAADSGSYTYTGTDATLTFASAGSYTLSADAGAYAYSGTNAALTADFSLAGDSGSYSYSGTNATLNRGYPLVAESGAYTYTGTNAAFSITATLSAESGVYTYSGSNVILQASGQVWTVQADEVTTWTARSDSSTTWTDQTDSSTTWTLQ